MGATTAGPLSPVPQVAQATGAAGSRSIPLPAGGGLVGTSHPFVRDLNGSVGAAPNRKRTGTQE